jgi:hypothetical protein
MGHNHDSAAVLICLTIRSVMSWDQDAHAPCRGGNLMHHNPRFYAIVVLMSVMSGADAEADSYKTSVDILGSTALTTQ